MRPRDEIMGEIIDFVLAMKGLVNGLGDNDMAVVQVKTLTATLEVLLDIRDQQNDLYAMIEQRLIQLVEKG